jgi:hypothetical protein
MHEQQMSLVFSFQGVYGGRGQPGRAPYNPHVDKYEYGPGRARPQKMTRETTPRERQLQAFRRFGYFRSDILHVMHPESPGHRVGDSLFLRWRRRGQV